MRETALQTPRLVKKEWGRCSTCQSRDSPAAHGEDHGEAGCLSAAHGEWRWSRYPHWRPWRTACWRRWTCPEGNYCLWREAYATTWSWQELPCMDEPVDKTYAGAVLEELQLVGRTHATAVCEGLYLVRGPTRWRRRTAWGSGRSSRDEVLWTDHNAHSPFSPSRSDGVKVKELEVTLSLRRRR